ncbi:MAG TPA: nuclear transport factor 2 family protein [Solirubrobacteraceae bacterium]|nr:nuclear transport factor 2 family protein [Solirubrobacteraceae bacterium]
MPGPFLRTIPLTALLAAAAVLAGCGGDDERDVRDVLERYAQAIERKDYQAFCDDVISKELVENVRDASGKPCEVALKGVFDEVEKPTVTVESVKLDGDRATAVTRTDAANEEPSTDTVQLVKEDGEWKIAALGS